MKINIDDLKTAGLLDLLPIEMKKLNESNYFVFWYRYDEKKSEISEIQNISIVKEITLNIYKTMPNYVTLNWSLGYFQLPLDTQNLMLYQFLKHHCKTDVDKNKLTEYYKSAKESDIENVNYRLQKTTWNNIYKIITRENFIDSLKRFYKGNEYLRNEIITIADTIDTYCKNEKNASFYGNVLESVVMGLKNKDGGLIPHYGNKLRYFYVGENSVQVQRDSKAQEKLLQAKEMLRSNFSPSEIYIKTGWYFSQNDYKWRQKLDNSKAKFVEIPVNTIFVKNDSKFVNRQTEIYEIIKDCVINDDHEIPNALAPMQEIIDSGWDVTLGDVFVNTDIYKHYPKLYNLPILYCKNDMPIREAGSYKYFYMPSKNPFICMFGNDEHWDMKAVLSHELQHSIQSIENFGSGGNPQLAQIIHIMGGEKVKRYFFLTHAIMKDMKAKCKPMGEFSFEKYKVWINKFLSMNIYQYFINPKTSEEYYENLDTILETLIRICAYILTKKKTEEDYVYKFLGEDNALKIKEIAKIEIASEKANVYQKLKGQGFSFKEASRILFAEYALLSGEMESRDVQNTSGIDEAIKDYLEPYTSESYDKNKVTTIFEDFAFDDVPNRQIFGAVEKSGVLKYIIHLMPTFEAEVILHELSHIVGDLIGNEKVTEILSNNWTEEQIEKWGGTSELFCEHFLCYLVKSDFSADITEEILNKRNSQILHSESLKELTNELNNMFFPTGDSINAKLTKSLAYVKEMIQLISAESYNSL